MDLHTQAGEIARRLNDVEGLATSLVNRAHIWAFGLNDRCSTRLPLAEEAESLVMRHGLEATASQVIPIVQAIRSSKSHRKSFVEAGNAPLPHTPPAPGSAPFHPPLPDFRTDKFVYNVKRLIEAGRYHKAIALCEQQLVRDYAIAEAYAGRGAAKEHLGDFKGALNDYATAINRDPSYISCYRDKGLVLLLLGQREEAQREFDLYLGHLPEKAEELRILIEQAITEGRTRKPFVQRADKRFIELEDQGLSSMIVRTETSDKVVYALSHFILNLNILLKVCFVVVVVVPLVITRVSWWAPITYIL